MDIVSLLVILFVVLLGMSTAYWLGKRHSAAVTEKVVEEIIVVEEFQLETKVSEGFKKLITRFEDARGRLYRFEWHPAYAHHFSDELVKASARALAPGEAE